MIELTSNWTHFGLNSLKGCNNPWWTCSETSVQLVNILFTKKVATCNMKRAMTIVMAHRTQACCHSKFFSTSMVNVYIRPICMSPMLCISQERKSQKWVSLLFHGKIKTSFVVDLHETCKWQNQSIMHSRVFHSSWTYVLSKLKPLHWRCLEPHEHEIHDMTFRHNIHEALHGGHKVSC